MYKPRVIKNPRKDVVGRFDRYEPVSTGKRVNPQPDDEMWFKKIREHGYLPSNMLSEFSKHIGRRKSPKSNQKRLLDLKRESNTPDGGRYLELHDDQRHKNKYDYGKFLTYHLNSNSLNRLKKIGLDHVKPPDPSGSARHDMQRAFMTATYELNCLREPEKYRFIQHWEVMERFNLKGKFPVSFSYDIDGHTFEHDGTLKPDAIFGIEYLEEKMTVYYLFEMDCMNERIFTRDMGVKSHTRSFLQYRKFLGGREYKNFFGNERVMGLLTTKSLVHMHSIMDYSRYLSADQKGVNYLAYNILNDNPDADPAFFIPPPVQYRFFDEPWERTSGKPFQLS